MNREEITLRLIKRDIECGLHSGIPTCCVKFYITEWVWTNFRGEFFESYWKKMNEKKQKTLNLFRYIPCPSCLEKGNFVEIKPCPEGDHCSYSKDR